MAIRIKELWQRWRKDFWRLLVTEWDFFVTTDLQPTLLLKENRQRIMLQASLVATYSTIF